MASSLYWKAYLSDGTHSTYTFKRPVSAATATEAIEQSENGCHEPSGRTTPIGQQITVVHIKEG